MEKLYRDFIRESISMELVVSDLYQLFSMKFPDDYRFWWTLSREEMNHAAMIESIGDLYFPDEKISEDQLHNQVEELMKNRLSLIQQIERMKVTPPTKEEAFRMAYRLENSIGEFQFEAFMTSSSDSPVVSVFKELNGHDVNHAKRIKAYAKTLGINIRPSSFH